MTYSTAFPPPPEADEREQADYWAWYDHEESRRKDYDQ